MSENEGGDSKFMTGFLVGFVVGGFPATAYWVYCGDVDLFDALILAELVAAGAVYALMALLASILHEDALADAFAAALAEWPASGCPVSPEAWLVTVARRKIIDEVRRRRTREVAAVLTWPVEEQHAGVARLSRGWRVVVQLGPGAGQRIVQRALEAEERDGLALFIRR